MSEDILLAFDRTPPAGRSLFVEEAAIGSTTLDERKRLYEHSLKDESPQMPKARSELLDTLAGDDPAYAIQALGNLVTVAPLGDFLGIGGRASLAQALRPRRVDLLQACEAWLGASPKPLLVLQIASILQDAFGDDETELLDALDAWRARSDSHKFIVLEVLHNILTRHVKDQAHPAAAKAQALVLKIAPAEQRTPTASAQKGRSQYLDVLGLAKALKRPPPQIDWNQLQENRKAVPSLVGFVGAQFQKIVAAKQDHPLAWLLHRRPPPQARLDQAMQRVRDAKVASEKPAVLLLYQLTAEDKNWLPYMEDVFSRLSPMIPGIGKLRTNLVNPTQTVDTLCEAELLSRAARTLKVEAEASGNGFTTPRDARISTSKGSIALEVYNPKPDRILEVAQGPVQLDPDLLMKKVRRKFQGQLKSQKPTEPLVIVIHGGQGPFDEWDIERILLGSQQTSIMMDKTTGRAISVRDEHDTDSLGDEDASSEMISGILLYRRNLASTPPTLVLQYTPNPKALRPLSPDAANELVRSLT